jgi:polar amino acid transport system permease protein
MDYHFTLRTIYPYLGELPGAIANTLIISAMAIFLSLIIGAAGAVARTSQSRGLRLVATAYVEIMRNVPLLVILYFVYFIAPSFGLRLSSFNSSLIALTLNSGAYMIEILRGGLIVVPAGQFEAARSQGMSTWTMLRRIILPQVARTIYAPLGNQVIQVILGSSLASVIAYNDITSWMENTGSSSYRFFESFAVAAVVYIFLCQVVNQFRVAAGKRLFKEGK